MPHRGNVYQSVIFAAQQSLDATGELPTTPSALAAQSGLDETQISSIFRTTADIYEGLLYHATTLLNDALRQGVIDAATDDPVRQMLSIGRSYLAWAEHNPALFRLIFSSAKTDVADPDLQAAGTIAYRHLVWLIEQLGGGEADVAALWAMSHGIADLASGQRLRSVSDRPDAEREAMIRNLIERVLPRA